VRQHCCLLVSAKLCGVRLEDYLNTAILLIAESFIHLWRLVETDSMSDHKRRISVPFLNLVQQRLGIALYVRLTRLEGQSFIMAAPIGILSAKPM
jgi:hypothetical protein